MATGFTPQDCSCDRCYKQDQPHITYRVEMDQELCDDCAQEMQGSIKPVRRKVLWFCEKHPEKEAEVFCETHQAAICQVCAITKTHRPCDMKDIHDEIDERKRRLVDKVYKGKSKGKEVKECELTLLRISREVDEHLEKLDHEINAAFDEEIKKLNEEKYKKATNINIEADNEITKITEQINKRRHERLQENDEDSNGKIQKLHDERGVLNRDLKHVKQKFEQESNLRKTKCQSLSNALVETLMEAEKLMNEEKGLLLEFIHAIRSLDIGLGTEINMENFCNISSIVEKISFRRDGGRAFGRLGVPSNEWNKEDEFNTGLGRRSFAIGSVENNGAVFRDFNGAVYVKNLTEGASRKIVFRKDPYDIRSCTQLDDGRIVCGTLNAKIFIYDPTWKHITRTIVLTKERKGKVTWVTTDKDGMIVAVVSGSRNIYVYSPDDEAFVRSVSSHSGLIHSIGCLSSGDMVVSTNCSQGQDVCVVDGSGVVKSTTHLHGKNLWSIAVDKLTDLIFVMYNVGKECAIDVMSPNGEVRARRIVTTTADSAYPLLHCSITDTGKLVVGIRSKISVYRQTLKTVNELSI